MLRIIAYHYVRDKKKALFKKLYALDIKDFNNQLDYLQKKYSLISLKDLIENRNIKNSALLTFDDGYLDHYKYVFPVLHKRKISGLFFAPYTTLKQKDLLDVNKLQIIFNKNINRKKLLKMLYNEMNKRSLNIQYYLKLQSEKKKKFDLRWHDKETNIIRNFLQYLLPKNDRKKIINQLFSKTVNIDSRDIIKQMYLNEKHAKEMINNNMFFGSHGTSHEWLEYLSYKDQYKDIKKSKDLLLNLGVKERYLTICYPFGSYNKQTIQISKKLNFKLGFANYKGVVRSIEKKPFELPRIDTNELM